MEEGTDLWIPQESEQLLGRTVSLFSLKYSQFYVLMIWRSSLKLLQHMHIESRINFERGE